ncbi:MAG TPA: DegT/DnrJ/EryC1/StrS family aminotransferase, partial [Steroidobacteraceae bacterium]|nr:DegT/DnrJ/EryC1/StrS family aminotransferase [Steroidobacteraceae bacterium]
RLGARYSALLQEAFVNAPADKQITTPFIAAGNTSVYAQYTIEVPQREFFETRMKSKGIPTAVHYPVPLHLQPVFANLGYKAGDFPVSEKIASRVVSLPMHPYLTEAQQQQVVTAVRESVLG